MARGTDDCVLVSFVALNNDPYNREAKRADAAEPAPYKKDRDGKTIMGPTLSLLFDPASPYVGAVRDAVLMYRDYRGQPRDFGYQVAPEVKREIAARDPKLSVFLEPWQTEASPSDHAAIFNFLKVLLPRLRDRFPGRTLLLHVSPGTPAMGTTLLLMAEAGYVDHPFKVVQSLRQDERGDGPLTVPVEVGLDTFFKRYAASSYERAKFPARDAPPMDPRRFTSSRLKELYKQAASYAQVNVPIVILGERGVGKSELARWIRLNSKFRRKEMDADWRGVECGQWNPETMQAELFGCVKGAFTGATEERKGLLAGFDGDTLFLDEIADIRPELQRLLIKALEDKSFRRMGDDATKVKRSDFRLIAATNIPERELRKHLHADFYDRVSMKRLTVPPLREIREELPWLWDSVLSTTAARADVEFDTLGIIPEQRERILEFLAAHPLPGNFRDLQRVAFGLVTAMADVQNRSTPDEAVTRALGELDAAPIAASDELGTARAIAAAFAEGQSLSGVLATVPKIDPDALSRHMNAWLAEQVIAVAKQRKVPAADLVTVCEKTLRNWRNAATPGKG